MTHNPYIYIFLAWITTYAMRVLPLTLIRKPIKNKFIRSFLHYVPYVTLSVMAFPAIINSTGSPLIGLASFAAGVIASWFGADTFTAAIVCSGAVLLLELIV